MTGVITRVGLTHLQIPFKEPLRTPAGELSFRDAILVAVETADGKVGVGECAPLPSPLGVPGATVADCWGDLASRIVPGLLGQRFGTTEEIAALASAWRDCRRPAVAGAETALWDLLGQARGLSLAELLGAAPEAIAAGVESGLCVGPFPTVVDLLRALEPYLSEGYRRVKLKVRPGHDLEFLAAVRQHFGADLPLMIDGDGTYSRSDLDLLRSLDEFDLLMIEQPMAADDLDGLAMLQAAITTPICLDETAADLGRLAEALKRGAGRIVNLKIQRLGGLGPAQAVHDACFEQGVACWVGTTPELGVGQAQGIHLATLPNCKYPTDIVPSARWFVDDYVVPRIEMTKAGRFNVSGRPGLGCQVDETVLRRHALRHEEFAGHPGP